MGFYERRVFPWLNEKLTAKPEVRTLRIEALQPARGRVVEIGFGSGLNLPLYPPAVTEVVAVEPNPGMFDRAKPAIARSTVPVEMIEGTAEQIPLPDGSVDTAVSTLTLCSVSDPGRALDELHRVLRDAGRLLVMEHGLADDPAVVRWQQRLNGIQNVVACGCNLNRPVASLVEAHGFRFEQRRAFYFAGAPRPMGWFTIGSAVRI